MAADATVARLLGDAPQLSVGILTADLAHLDNELHRLEAAEITIVHTDVMDGVFCPMLTVGAPFVAAQRTRLVKDVHLMIHEPLEQVAAFVAAGADMITFQVESASNPRRVLRVLGDATNVNDPARGILRGIALSPGTPLEVLPPLLDEVDYVMLLAIDPGWSGQRFARSTVARAARVRDMISAAGRPILLGIDGGVTRSNIGEIATLGADVIVTGSAIFDGTAEVVANAHAMRAGLHIPTAG